MNIFNQLLGLDLTMNFNQSNNTHPLNTLTQFPQQQQIQEQKKEEKIEQQQQLDMSALMALNQIEMLNTVDPKQSLLYSNMLIQQQQNLINQLIQNNISDLSNNNNHNEKQQQAEDKDNEDLDDEEDESKKILRKRIKKQNICGHQDREHYAKGMCANCYHRKGRTKKPYKCGHSKLYAKGYCQNCYINRYNQQRRDVNEVLDHSSEQKDSVDPQIEAQQQQQDQQSSTNNTNNNIV